MILGSSISKSLADQSVNGRRQPTKELYPPMDSKLPKALKQKLGVSVMSTDAYLQMQEYAKWVPRGKRALKLNIPELRDLLVSNDLESAPLTKTAGLNKGGKLSYADGQKKMSKLLTQQEHLQQITIKNENRGKNEANVGGGPNPNFASFKNRFRIK